MDQRGADAVETLLDIAHGGETDWLEKKAAVYVSAEKDPAFQVKLEKLEKCSADVVAQETRRYEAELLRSIACALVALHNSRGGVLFVGIDDANNPVPLQECDCDGILAKEGLEAYVRKAVLGRICPKGGFFECGRTNWTVPAESLEIETKVCSYKGANVLALLVPPLERGCPPVLVTRTENNRPRKLLLRRTPGDVGAVRTDELESSWNGSAAALADFHDVRERAFLSNTDLFGKLRELEIEPPPETPRLRYWATAPQRRLLLYMAGILGLVSIIGLTVLGTLQIRVRGVLTRKEKIEKLLHEKALVLSRTAFATSLGETLAEKVDPKVVDKAVNGFWKEATLYNEALVDIAFALQAPEGTDLVGEAEKILQVRLGAGLEAAIREEARRICRYRVEFTGDALEAFGMSGKENTFARDMLAAILVDAVHGEDFNRCCLDMEAARFLVDEALGKGTMGVQKTLRMNVEDIREYRRRCRAVQDAVLQERMNVAVILTFRGAYTDIGAPDFADRLTEAISRATEIPREEFGERFAKLLDEGRLLLAMNLAQRYAQMLKVRGQAGEIDWPLSEEDVGRVVETIAHRTGIGEGQIRLAFDNACR